MPICRRSPRVIVRGTMRGHPRHEIRAAVAATMSVLEYHNLGLRRDPVTVCVVGRGKLGRTRVGDIEVAAESYPERSLIRLEDYRVTVDELLSNVIHEVIHLYVEPPRREEWTVSTLTARLKPDVTKVYNVLVSGTRRRAAYLAHCHGHMAYPRSVRRDRYNDEQEIETNPRRFRR